MTEIEYRNPRFTAAGTIDCEVNDPRLGWVPFHATPDDPEDYGRDIFAACKNIAAPYVEHKEWA